ncbi:unnamed protein product [Amoebophrya sp. A120]|nr:unnamed protein product [Amoebophrya sp. A120]|eukprot:GSA120T00017166001.1
MRGLSFWIWLLPLLSFLECGLRAASGSDVTDMLTKTLLNCPLCADKEPCFVDCKASGAGWDKCLQRCLGDNPMMLDMFSHMTEKLQARKQAMVGTTTGGQAEASKHDFSATTAAAGGMKKKPLILEGKPLKSFGREL